LIRLSFEPANLYQKIYQLAQGVFYLVTVIIIGFAVPIALSIFKWGFIEKLTPKHILTFTALMVLATFVIICMCYIK